MASQVYFSPFIPAFNGNGLPEPSAKLYFFYTGTDNLAPIYEDAGMTTPMDNPVVADLAARFNNVYLDDAITYRVRMTTSTGAPIGADIDPYYPGQAYVTVPDLTELLAPDGASLVGYTLGVAGAINTSLQEVGRRTIHIKDFGAVPGASAADNNTAIQAALDYATTHAPCGVDFGSTGTYAITGLLISGSTGKVALYGRGATLTKTGATPAFTVVNSQNVSFDGIRVIGSSGTADNGQYGFFFNTTAYCDVRDCYLEALSVGFYANDTARGYPLSGSFQLPSVASGNTIRNCRRGAYFRDGGVANTYGEYWRFTDNTVTDCANAGIWCEAGNTSITNNTVAGNSLGIVLFSAGGSNGDHGICSHNTINHNVAVGLYIGANLRSWIIVGNNIWATLGGPSGTQKLNDFFGGADQGYAFGVYLDNVHNVTLTDNVVGRNQFNMATKIVLQSVIKNNQFLTDPVNTVANTWDYTSGGAFYSVGNFFGPNVYDGAWTDTTTFPHNGDFNRWIKVGTAGAPAFANSWVNYGTGFPDAAFSKDGNGVVRLAGLIKTGTVGTAAFTLPTGFRPFDGVKSFSTLSNGAAGGVQVAPGGDVNIVAPSNNTYVSLDCVLIPTS